VPRRVGRDMYSSRQSQESKVPENKDRLHFRRALAIRARVTGAASITGQRLTDFAISALSERADKMLERHDTLLFDARLIASR